MRTILGAAFGTAVSIAMAGYATAADMPVRNYYTAPATYSASSWAGPYIGGQFGYEWGTVSNNPARPDGFQGGVEAGYNWQFGQFVVGGETDLNISGAQDTTAGFQFSNQWYGTVRGRAGIAFNNILLYGTAGLGYGALSGQAPGFLSSSRTSAGFVAGAGVEYGFAAHWSAKAEWLYLDLADRSFPATGTNNGLAANLVRFGLNYHF
jgi:outer membrane immunogenic protein